MNDIPDTITPLPATREDNGILARVPAQYIVAATRLLPDPSCATDDEMRVEIDAAWAGRVRLTFMKLRYRKARSRPYVSWLCRHAEEVAAPSGDPSQTQNSASC